MGFQMRASVVSGVALAIILLGFVDESLAMRKQGVAVKGKLLCGIMPAAANTTKVRIVDIDTGNFDF